MWQLKSDQRSGQKTELHSSVQETFRAVTDARYDCNVGSIAVANHIRRRVLKRAHFPAADLSVSKKVQGIVVLVREGHQNGKLSLARIWFSECGGTITRFYNGYIFLRMTLSVHINFFTYFHVLRPSNKRWYSHTPWEGTQYQRDKGLGAPQIK